MKYLVVIASIAIISWTGPAHSQDETPSATPSTEEIIAWEVKKGAPTQSFGFEGMKLGAIPLEGYFEVMKGNELRVREVVFQPGSKIAVHSHDRSPAVVHVLQGELVEHRSDREEPIIRRQGDTYFETRGLVHWAENVSPNLTRILAVGVLPNNAE